VLAGGDRIVNADARGRPWRQWLAAGVAVLVAIAAAVAVVGLRNARQAGGTAGSATPPARSGAAMAYDSTAGVTVMFGGRSASGAILNDTWEWNGSGWSSATTAGGPGALLSPTMSDDPADGGVLLLGAPEIAPVAPQPGVCGIGGGSVSGSGSGSVGVGGTGSATSAVAGPTVSAGVVPGGAIGSNPIPPCAALVPAAVQQTWLLTAQGWSHVGTAAAATAGNEPPGGAPLAYDAASTEVVAVWLSLSPCPPPLENGSGMLPAFMCPLPAMAAPTGTPASLAPALATDVPGGTTVVPGAAPLIPCQPTSCLVAPARPCIATSFPAVPCGGFAPKVSTWTWSHGRWTAHAQQAAPAGAEDALLAGDANGGLILLTESLPTIPFCVHPAVGCTPTVPAMIATTWTWRGAAWDTTTGGPAGADGPPLAGAHLAQAGGEMVVVTAAGQTWTRDGAGWKRQTDSGPGPRTGVAMAGAPSSTVVFFGGIADPSKAGYLLGVSRPGGDTWVWNGSAWRSAGGAAPGTPAPVPSCPPGVTIQCVGPPASGIPYPVPAPPHTPLATLLPSPSPG
jgi:hypothetical protein